MSNSGGMYDWLEDRICEICEYDPNDPLRKNEEQYLQFKDEIERHLAGELTMNQLSLSAQSLIYEWEAIMEESMNEVNRWEEGDL